MIPRWGFGLWVTGYPQENQETAAAHVEKHRAEQIPLDAVILDYHWEEHFHNFKWREKLIPQPDKLISDLKSQGVRLGLILTSYLNTHNRPLQKWLLNTFGNNVTPGLEADDERALDEFYEAKTKGYLAHENVRWWFGKGGMIDFTNPGAVTWWQDKLKPLFEAGISFIKNDDGEDLPDDAVTFNGMNGQENHNNYGFYYGKATYEIDLMQDNTNSADPEKNIKPRNIIYARSAWVGSQRYPALFMGDQEANFEGIRRGIRAGLNLAMGGFSYWTADVFGLSGKTTPETHMRYAQWALLSPVARYFFRPAVIDDTRYPWSHKLEVEKNFRKYTKLRMRLLPYFANLGLESYLTGVPIMRPLILEFEKDDRLRKVDDQIMLGPGLMICPVTTQGALKRRIVLPAGRWFDFFSDQCWEGPAEIEYDAPMNHLPLLVKSGSIIPMGNVLQHIPADHQFEDLELHFWPSFQAEYLFFEEDGCSTAYRFSGYSKSRIVINEDAEKIKITIFPVEGKFEGQKAHRELSLFLHNLDESKVKSIFAGSAGIPYQNEQKSLKFSAGYEIFTGIEIITHLLKGDDQ
ncbi:MAG: TIM-barrel domain-containing protein [Chloroflexota bacterium]